MRKEKQRRGFWKRIRFKYKLSATNENTLEEVWRIRTSIFSGAIIFAGIAFLLISLTSIIIITTPIRYYLPGYLDTEIREQAIRTALRIDSLEQRIRFQDVYINNIKQIVSGTIPLDSVSRLDSVYIAENDPILEKSEREKEFVAKYEEEEKYTLGFFASQAKGDDALFYKPVNGVVIKHFDQQNENYQVVIQTAKLENVLAVQEGVVMATGYDMEDKYFVYVQHKNGYVSIYKGLTQVMKKTGDILKANEAIGAIMMKKEVKGDKIEEIGGLLIFELWNKGNPVDPEAHITF